MNLPCCKRLASNKCAERPFVIDDDKPDGGQDTPSSSKSNAESASLDGTLCTPPSTPTTPSSPKNDLEGGDDSFDYDAILDGDNTKWGVRSADAELRKATPHCPCDPSLHSLSEPLQGQISQDDNANISRNGSEVPSMSSSNMSEKDDVGQKQLRYQAVEDDVEEEGVEELGKECNMNSSGDSSDNNDDDSTNQDSNEGPRRAKRRRLHRPRSEPDDDTSAASAALRSTKLGEPQPVDRVTDAGQEWEIRSIIGRQKVDGIVQYWVEWEPTWMPKSELMGARELVDEFEARLQASRGNRNEHEETDAVGETKPKRQRGRPLKKK